MPTRLLSNPEALMAIGGHTVRSMGTILIDSLIKKMAWQCQILKVNVKILSPNNDQNVAGSSCAREIILGFPFLVDSSLKVKQFLADNLEGIY